MTETETIEVVVCEIEVLVQDLVVHPTISEAIFEVSRIDPGGDIGNHSVVNHILFLQLDVALPLVLLL